MTGEIMGISQTVGLGGRNLHSDVKVVQRLLQSKGFSQIREDGICGPRTIHAIKSIQSKFMRYPDGLINVNGRTWHNLNSDNAVPYTTSLTTLPETNHPISGPLRVKFGQVTFDAEGNDIPSSRFFSRVIHWPPTSLSGVTIGRGYDLGGRNESSVYNDLIRAGVPAVQAEMISKGAGKKGEAARIFVENNKTAIGEISHLMQINLFEFIYPSYIQRARTNYDSWTSNYPNRTQWQDLKPVIRDIMVDFVYQGFTKGEAPMKAGMNNDVDELIRYIENSPVMQSYEQGRGRVRYLKNNR